MFLLAAIVSAAIRVDQVGYPSNAPKIAIVAARQSPHFTIVRADGSIAGEGRLSPPMFDRDSGDRVQLADFSSLTAPGTYTLRVAGESTNVTIGDDPYRSLLRLTTRAFTGQRCGTAVDLGGGYSHPACHLQSAFHRSSGHTGPAHVTGGWHDAGDYGRYVVNSGISTGTLPWANELFSADILDEIRWNLEWMLAMQDDDGGAWHKETSESFPPFVQPQDDHSLQYVIGRSSCATADLAAVAAIASRVYRSVDEPFARRSLGAAQRAWSWLKDHPNITFRNPPGVKTGEYDDRDCSDERLWAAAELWRSSGDAGAHAYFRQHWREALRMNGPPDWSHVGALAAWTYVLSNRGDAGIANAIRDRSLAGADEIVQRSRQHAYRIPMRTRDYMWGSNAVAANYGLELLVANAMKPDRSYIDTTFEIIHYLLGRNPFSLSWVTGAGTNSVQRPHHRPSASDQVDAPWPGLLAGGPNRNRQDPALRKLPRGVPPARMYVDDQESYASNEVAINWNAPLVFILAGTSEVARRGEP